MKLSELLKKTWLDLALIFFATCALLLNLFSKSALTESALFYISVVGFLPVAVSAVKALISKQISVDLLASVALVVSFLNGEWVSAAFINLMLASSRILAKYTDGRATAAIKSLLKFRPEKIRVLRGGEPKLINPQEIKLGEIVLINPGERIPVDGKILKGRTTVDQASLTGESMPIEKGAGDHVFSSTMNISAPLEVEAEKVGKDTALEKIIALVEKSQKGKAKIHTAGEKFAAIYIFVSMLLAGILYLATGKLELVLSVLLVVCADDIAVAVPLAFLASIGRAAKRGVIVKGGNYLEQIAKAKVVVLDKTGTLTKGKLTVNEIVSEIPTNEFLNLLANSAYFSNHPVSKAIAEHLKGQNILPPEMPEVKELAGRGLSIYLNKEQIFYGKKGLFLEQDISIPGNILKKIDETENLGQAVVILGSKEKIYGFVALSDEIREGVRESILKLKELGVERIVMLTGDNEVVAKKIANQVLIDEFQANLMPEDKVKYLQNSPHKGRGLVMVGDGVNDSAALVLSDVGIAMGEIGSDSAIEASNITLMKDDFREIPKIMELAKETVRVSRQDFYIWGLSNAVGLILVFSGIIGPAGAAAYNFLTDFLPLGNSLKLFNNKNHN